MKKYRYIVDGSIVEAAQFQALKDGEVLVLGLIILRLYKDILDCRICPTGSNHGVVDTDEGLLIVHPGDMVVKEADGGLWPWSREVFSRTFEAVGDDTYKPPWPPVEGQEIWAVTSAGETCGLIVDYVGGGYCRMAGPLCDYKWCNHECFPTRALAEEYIAWRKERGLI